MLSVSAIENIITLMGASEIDARLEEQLIDGILYAFQVSRQQYLDSYWAFTCAGRT